MPRQIEAAGAFFRIYAKDGEFRRSLANIQASMKKTAASVGSLGVKLSAAGAALSAPLAIAVKSAADAAEELNKFEAVFGNLSNAAAEWAATTASAVNRSAREVRKALGDFQSFFVGLGFARDEASELSKQMTALAIDFASFNNLTDAEAIQRFQQALKGSTEVLSGYGIDVSAAALATRGIGTSASIAEKAMARLQIIAEKMGDQGAVGDAAKTAGSFSNRLKGLRAAISDLSDAVGGPLLSGLAEVAKVMTDGIRTAQKFVTENQGLVAIYGAIAVGLTAAGAALTGIAVAFYAGSAAVGVFSAAWGALGTVIAAITSPIGIAVAAIAGLAAAWVQFTDIGQQTAGIIGDSFANLIGEIGETLGQIGELLAAGQITAAAELLWAQLRVIWQQGVNYLKSVWIELTNNLAIVWVNTLSAIQSTITQVVNFFQNAWSAAVNFVARILLRIQGFFDKSFDAQGAIAALDQAAEAAKRARDAGAGAAIGDIERERQAVVDTINASRGEQLAGLEAELEKYKGEFGKARSKAEAIIEQTKRERETQRQQVEVAVQQAAPAARGTGAGTFQGGIVAAQILGGGQDVDRQQLKEQKRIADGVDKLIKVQEQYYVSFV